MIELNLNKRNEYVLQHGDILVDKYDDTTIVMLVKVNEDKYHLVVLNDNCLDLCETIHTESVSLYFIKENYKLLKKHNEYKMTIDEL